jgi:hypothetical protein
VPESEGNGRIGRKQPLLRPGLKERLGQDAADRPGTS